jgi:hypothetical protein
MSATPVTRGRQGVCHLLADVARQRSQPLARSDAVRWAVQIGVLIAQRSQLVTLDPPRDVAGYLRAMGAGRHVIERSSLPGVPCQTCVATQVLPMHVAGDVVRLAELLSCEPPQAFLWASRVGSIVLSHPATDRASTPVDALGALVASEYLLERRQADCDLLVASG